MMMPEDEAKLKWCPMARLSEMGGTYNRCGPSANLQCIGSACMAWRTGVWDHQRNLKPEDRTPGVGYCGAFGRPKS